MRAPRPFRVPFGIEPAGTPLRPEDAHRDVTYGCPGCGEHLVLRTGTRRPHFSHRASSTCSPETALHQAAKRLVVLAVERWKRGEAPAPIVHRACAGCSAHVEQALPAEHVDGAELERRLPTGHVVDVALLHAGAVRSAIEIRVTHAVGEKKAACLNIPFIELNGEAVVAEPGRWVPIHDAFLPVRCAGCRRAARYRRDQEARLEAALIEVGFARDAYPLFVPVTTRPCRHCGAHVPLYRYEGSTRPGEVPSPKHTRVVEARAFYVVELSTPGLLPSPLSRTVVRSRCQRCGTVLQR